jgi:hypothetical protein
MRSVDITTGLSAAVIVVGIGIGIVIGTGMDRSMRVTPTMPGTSRSACVRTIIGVSVHLAASPP